MLNRNSSEVPLFQRAIIFGSAFALIALLANGGFTPSRVEAQLIPSPGGTIPEEDDIVDKVFDVLNLTATDVNGDLDSTVTAEVVRSGSDSSQVITTTNAFIMNGGGKLQTSTGYGGSISVAFVGGGAHEVSADLDLGTENTLTGYKISTGNPDLTGRIAFTTTSEITFVEPPTDTVSSAATTGDGVTEVFSAVTVDSLSLQIPESGTSISISDVAEGAQLTFIPNEGGHAASVGAAGDKIELQVSPDDTNGVEVAISTDGTQRIFRLTEEQISGNSGVIDNAAGTVSIDTNADGVVDTVINIDGKPINLSTLYLPMILTQ